MVPSTVSWTRSVTARAIRSCSASPKNIGRLVLPAWGWQGGVVGRVEEFYQMLVADNGRIEIQLNALRIVSDTVVGRIIARAAGIPHARSYHSRDGAELRLCAPESAECEGRGLKVLRSRDIDGRKRRVHRNPHAFCGRHHAHLLTRAAADRGEGQAGAQAQHKIVSPTVVSTWRDFMRSFPPLDRWGA